MRCAPRTGAGEDPAPVVDVIECSPMPAQQRPEPPRNELRGPFCAAVDLHMRALDDGQAQPVYDLGEGHRTVLPQWLPSPVKHSGHDSADGLLLRSREVSTLLRVRPA